MVIFACLLVSGCRNTPIGRFFRTVLVVGEILAWVCGIAYVLVFFVGGLMALIKTRRAPTERSRAWARRLGIVNLLFGLLFVGSMLADPPRSAPPPTQVDDFELPRSYAERHADGEIELGSLFALVGMGLGVTAFGAVSYRSGRDRPPPVR